MELSNQESVLEDRKIPFGNDKNLLKIFCNEVLVNHKVFQQLYF